MPAKDFLQKDPDEGKPATEPTEVRFLYDDDALYVGARMFDSEPSKIAKRLTRRDGDTDGIADRIIVGIDAHHDKLTGSMFWVTAAGSIGDGVLFNDSSDDDTWNGVWDAAVSIDDKGLDRGDAHPVLAAPVLERRTGRCGGCTSSAWCSASRRSRGGRSCPRTRAGSCRSRANSTGSTASRAGATSSCCRTSPRGARSAARRSPATPSTTAARPPASIGLDAKWGFASNMTLDATVNPDFGQVEVDPAVVNLSVFETFYEEKRPFFIEGSQAFDNFGRNGASGYMGFNRTNPSLFYSRRIGRTPQGAAAGEYVDRPSVDDDHRRRESDRQDEPGLDGQLHRRRHRAGVCRHIHPRRAGQDRGGAVLQLPGGPRAPGRRPARRDSACSRRP